MPHPGMLHPEPMPQPPMTHTSTGHTQNTHRQVWLSLCRVSWCTQFLFEPSEHLWRVWGLILNVILPLPPSCCAFSFALECGVSFFGGIHHSSVSVCSAMSRNFGVLTGEDERTSFYSVTWCAVGFSTGY